MGAPFVKSPPSAETVNVSVTVGSARVAFTVYTCAAAMRRTCSSFRKPCSSKTTV
jgi:hypothetical protein